MRVQFNDLSQKATEWKWDFGDGTSSRDQSPGHTYSLPGNYTVLLTAINDEGTHSKRAIITVPEQPQIHYAYIPNGDSNNVSVIDTATNKVIDTVDIESSPEGVSVSPDGRRVYVANLNSSTVSVIDTTKNNVTATVNVGKKPHGIAVTPDGTKVYVANYGGSTTSVINTSYNNVTANVRVGNNPFRKKNVMIFIFFKNLLLTTCFIYFPLFFAKFFEKHS